MDTPTIIFLACSGAPALLFTVLFIASGLRSNKITLTQLIEATEDEGDGDYNFYGNPSV